MRARFARRKTNQELTPYRTVDLPHEAGPEAGSGLCCIGYFRLIDHLRPYRTHAQKPPDACVPGLISDLSRKAGLDTPVSRPIEAQVAALVDRLPPPFPSGAPAWALALKSREWRDEEDNRPEVWPAWPRLTVEQGIVLLARTAGGQYLAAREIHYDPVDWLGGVAWFVPSGTVPEEES